MNRRIFLIGVAGLALAAGAALAADPAQVVIDRLRTEGFENITAARTFIGRIRITASKRGQSREVVIDPRTGEILRDLIRATSTVAAASGSGGDSGSSSGGSSGGGGSDHGGSDDGGDDSDSDSGGSDHDSGDHDDD